jgi:hypothetical protein
MPGLADSEPCMDRRTAAVGFVALGVILLVWGTGYAFQSVGFCFALKCKLPAPDPTPFYVFTVGGFVVLAIGVFLRLRTPSETR